MNHIENTYVNYDEVIKNYGSVAIESKIKTISTQRIKSCN